MQADQESATGEPHATLPKEGGGSCTAVLTAQGGGGPVGADEHKKKVPVYWAGGTLCYVWHPEAAIKLRDLRLCGTLVGCAPTLVQSTIHHLPLQLMEEEVTLALENDWIELHNARSVLGCEPVPDQFARQDLAPSTVVSIPTEAFALGDEHSSSTTPEPGAASTSKWEPPSISPSLPALSPESWRAIFPTTELQRIKSMVFRDLWQRGFYLTPGNTFGAHFLAYPEYQSPLDIIARARVGVAVKKSLILASLSPENEVQYFTVDWQGVT